MLDGLEKRLRASEDVHARLRPRHRPSLAVVSGEGRGRSKRRAKLEVVRDE